MDLSLKKLKRKYSFNSAVVIVAVAVILILVNVISTRTFLRFDWTTNNRFTISDFTVRMLQGLGDVITVKAYVSSQLPPSIQPVANQLRDLFDEYEAFGGGNFQYRFIDPALDEEAMSEVQTLGIQQIQMQVRDRDRFETQRGFMGVGVFFGGDHEVIPVVQDFSNLEYEVSSLILKLVMEKKKVGFLKGHGEHGIEALPFMTEDKTNDYSQIRKLLEKNYEVGIVDLSEGKPIADIHTLVVAGGNKPLSQRELFEIDQFVMNGGNVVFLVDTIAQVLGISVVEQKQSNVNSLLEKYGMKVNYDMLLDRVSEYANFSSGGPFTFLVQYPPFIKIVNASLPVHPIVSKIDSVVLRWVSSVSTSAIEGIIYTPILRTSELGWVESNEEGRYEVDPNKIRQPAESEVGQKDIAVLAVGKFRSDFGDVPVLETLHEKEGGGFEFRKVSKDEYRVRDVQSESSGSSKIVVVSDSDFIADELVRGNQSGALFFLNVVDFLTLGDGLIDIRAKSLGSAVVLPLSDSAKTLIKYIGILLVPFLVTLYGVVRFSMRRRS